MRKQHHKVDLTAEERQILERLVRKGEHSALKRLAAGLGSRASHRHRLGRGSQTSFR